MCDYAHYNIKHSWFFKYDAEKYTNIRKISDFLGKDICESILGFHVIADSEATSYFFRSGKVKHLKKRAQLETFTWLRCCDESIQNLEPEESGWKLTDNVLKPLWFNVFTLVKMTFVINKMIFIIKDKIFQSNVFLSAILLIKIISRVGKASNIGKF